MNFSRFLPPQQTSDLFTGSGSKEGPARGLSWVVRVHTKLIPTPEKSAAGFQHESCGQVHVNLCGHLDGGGDPDLDIDRAYSRARSAFELPRPHVFFIPALCARCSISLAFCSNWGQSTPNDQQVVTHSPVPRTRLRCSLHRWHRQRVSASRRVCVVRTSAVTLERIASSRVDCRSCCRNGEDAALLLACSTSSAVTPESCIACCASRLTSSH